MEGITLRSLTIEDLDFLIALENDPQFWHLSQTKQPYAKEDLENYIHNAQQSLAEACQQRFVISNTQKTALGFIDLYAYDPLHRRAGVGILVHPRWQGMGVGYKALEMLSDLAKNRFSLHQLYALISPENVKSLALFEKCDFSKSALKKDWYFYNDQFHDMWLYQKIMHV